MKYLIICFFLVSVAIVSAENMENSGQRNFMKVMPSEIEGAVGETNMKVNTSVKVSGEEYDFKGGQINTRCPVTILDSELPDPNDPTSNKGYNNPIQMPAPKRNEAPSGKMNDRWGNDILIVDKEVGEGQDFDEDEVTNDIYAIFDTYHTTGDSVPVYRSTDGGLTWNFFIFGYNADGEVGNPKVRVVRDAGGQSWVCFIGIWYEPAGQRTLWMRRVRTDGSGAVWEQVAPDSVLWADIDGDIGTGGWLYCTYCKQNPSWNSIYAARNALAGAGWQNNQDLFDDPQVFPYPAISAGAGGNVAVTFVDDRLTTNIEVRIKRSLDYGNSWLSSEQVSNNAGAATLTYTDIGYSHGATQTGWIFVTFVWSTDDNLAYYYSTNSGVNWTYGTVIGPSSNDENMSSLRCRKATGSLTVAYNADPGDSTMFTWATASNPTNFSAPVRINDYAATSIWPPTAGWITSGAAWSAIIYSSSTMGYRPYFDWFGNTGIAEGKQQIALRGLHLAPNPSNGNTKLSYMVNREGNVMVSLYDASGRLVNNLVNESKKPGEYGVNISNQNLSSGVYFIRIKTEDGIATKTMTVVR